MRQPWEHALKITDNLDLQLEGAKMSQGSDLLGNALCRSSTNWSCFEGLAGRARNHSNRDIFVTCCQANAYGHGAVLAGLNKHRKGMYASCYMVRKSDVVQAHRTGHDCVYSRKLDFAALRQSSSFSQDRCTFCVRG